VKKLQPELSTEDARTEEVLDGFILLVTQGAMLRMTKTPSSEYISYPTLIILRMIVFFKKMSYFYILQSSIISKYN
jgi:hypothetical protein